jgi:hypothetical protein
LSEGPAAKLTALTRSGGVLIVDLAAGSYAAVISPFESAQSYLPDIPPLFARAVGTSLIVVDNPGQTQIERLDLASSSWSKALPQGFPEECPITPRDLSGAHLTRLEDTAQFALVVPCPDGAMLFRSADLSNWDSLYNFFNLGSLQNVAVLPSADGTVSFKAISSKGWLGIRYSRGASETIEGSALSNAVYSNREFLYAVIREASQTTVSRFSWAKRTWETVGTPIRTPCKAAQLASEDSQHIAVLCKVDKAKPFERGQAWYATTDGGQSWSSSF